MPEASRISDTTLHGGAINQGAKLVIIGGMKAARKGDSYICPAHGTGVIIEGAEQVFIEGAHAARKFDKCGCAAVGVSGTGVPPTVGAPPMQWNGSLDPKDPGIMNADLDKMNAETGNTIPARVMFAEGELTDSDKDGTLDNARGEFGAVRMRNQAYGNAGPVEFGAKHNLDVFYGRGQVSQTVDGQGWVPGISRNGGVEAGMVKQGGEVSIGPANDQGRNPYAAIGGEYNLLHAEAKGDFLLGDDGRRVGIVGMGKAGAEVASAKGTGRASIPIPFTGWTIGGRGELEGAAGAVGGGAGGWLYYDKEEGRLHIGLMGKFEWALGGEVNLDLSIGRAYQPPEASPPPGDVPSTPGIGPNGIPNALAQGHPQVLIGGVAV